jgi:para-aminobenzoate synthetase component 1
MEKIQFPFETPYFFLLDSSLAGERGRYSIAAWDPLLVYEAKGADDPFEFLQNDLRRRAPIEAPDLPFAGGWIGYFGYELYSHLEKKVPPREPDLIPRAVFCFYDRFYLYDHVKQQAKLIQLQGGRGPLRSSAELLASFIEVASGRGAPTPAPDGTLLQQGATSSKSSKTSGIPFLPFLSSNFSQENYLNAIRRIKNYIAAGDCYQVNLSQKFQAPAIDNPYAIYQRLRSWSPAPYAAYLNLGDAQILSSSPECFLEVDSRRVVTRPIKGTRPRGKNEAEDRRLRRELEGSAKDRAELLMITDLERNDLGRVCVPGSIEVSELSRIETFAQVHHQVATIRGELSPGKDIIDLLRATFPGGSITGAPKVRAMQIIRELEPDPRNVYCGAIGFLSLNGKAQFNVAIRTMILKDGMAHFWAGGGIVADSDPEAEYEETLAKAKGMREALQIDGRDRLDNRRLEEMREEESDHDPRNQEHVINPDRVEIG